MKAARFLKPWVIPSFILLAVGVIANTLGRPPKLQTTGVISPLFQQDDFQQSLANVNQQIRSSIESNLLGIDPGEIAPRADNLQIARRISLALIGSGMSLEEVRAFQSIPEQDQIRWWTSNLLQDPRWSNYFAQRFSRAFVGTNTGQILLFRRWKFNRWLADGFQRGIGYDQIVHSMIRAEGLWTDTPAVNFVTATIDEGNEGRADPIRLAGRTSRAFLAQRMDCLQCHDDYLDNTYFGTADDPTPGSQQNFHSLAAFYSGAALPDLPFRGIIEDGRDYQVEFLGDTAAREVAVGVPFAAELLPNDGKPRDRLAAWVTHRDNPAFARAAVNRVWALMFGLPLVAPVDQIPLHSDVPPALDILADDFRQHGFDVRRLVHLIVQSEAFQRDSQADFGITQHHEQLWAVFPLSPMRPDQVVSSILQSSRLATINQSSSLITRLDAWGSSFDFMNLFGDRGEDEFQADAVTIPQRLILMNGQIVAEKTEVDLVMNAATRIASLVHDDRKAVEMAFLATLNRSPDSDEIDTFASHLSGKSGEDRGAALSDIFWAMWNSTEFSWNH